MTYSETLLTWLPIENMGKSEKKSGGNDNGHQNGKNNPHFFIQKNFKISSATQVSTAQNKNYLLTKYPHS